MDGFYRWLAWRLPRGLCKWVVARVAQHATSGQWSLGQPNRVTAIECLRRWHRDIPPLIAPQAQKANHGEGPGNTQGGQRQAEADEG